MSTSFGLVRPRRFLLAGVALLVAGLLAISTLMPEEDGDAMPAGDVHDQLCAALATRDATQAAEQFSYRVHRPLHGLAASAQVKDQAVAARLLEAKERVEASLEEQSSLLVELGALEPRVRDALALDGRVIDPCGGPTS